MSRSHRGSGVELIKNLPISARMTSIGVGEGVDQGKSAPASHALADEAPKEPSTVGTKSPDVAAPESEVVGKHNRLLKASPRRRDKAHLRYIAAKACLVCGRQLPRL